MVGAVALILGLRFFFLISRYSVNILFYDQWDFLGSFFDHDPGIAELFLLQHGPHREGVGLIADKFLYAVTSWSVRSESFMIGLCIFVAMLLALRLKKRLFGRMDYSDVLIPMIFLTFAQFETVIGTPNPSYSGFPVLLMMLYGLALIQEHYPLKLAMILLVNFLLIYTGFGVFAGVVTIGLFALFCYWSWRRIIALRLATSVVSLFLASASMASFFVHYRFQPAVDCFYYPHHEVLDYPWFIALMFTTFAGIRSPIILATVLGAVLLVVAISIIFLVMRRAGQDQRLRPVALIIAVMASYSLLFSANTAVGRVCLGLPAAAQASRYTTLMIPVFLAIYLYVLTVRTKARRDIALVLLALILIPGHVHIPNGADWFSNGKRTWVSCYKRTGDVLYCDSTTGFQIYPDPHRTHLQQKLDYLKENKLNLFAE